MKKQLFSLGLYLIIFVIFFLNLNSNVFASHVTVNLFYSSSCPHCMKEKPFLEDLANSDSEVSLRTFNVGKNENIKILEKTLKKTGDIYRGVPVTVISDKIIVGYSSDETTGQEIKSIINSVKQTGDLDIVGQVISDDTPISTPTQTPIVTQTPTLTPTSSPTPKPVSTTIKPTKTYTQVPSQTESKTPTPSISDIEIKPEFTPKEEKVTSTKTKKPSPTNSQEKKSFDDPLEKQFEVPILGQVSAKQFSLPVLTILLGLLDGFNPCAMWALLFLISLLLGMEDRKRMWILGVAFIVTSAFVYFLFMTAWLNFFVFLGYVSWIQKGIGIFAIGVGIYNLYDYMFGKSGCKGQQIDKKRKVFSKLKNVALKENLFIALFGIITLAFAVNLVELLCSAGLPAIYTQVLSLSNLNTFQYYLYMLLYILFFMIDDLFVFFAAMITLKAVGIESKYSKISRLIGGIIIFIIGMILILRPELLAFG